MSDFGADICEGRVTLEIGGGRGRACALEFEPHRVRVNAVLFLGSPSVASVSDHVI